MVSFFISDHYYLISFFSEDLENASDKESVIACCLATVLNKTFQLKTPSVLALTEKCPTFVSKDSKRARYLFGYAHKMKKTVQVQGHNFELRHFTQHTLCNQSHQIIWGIGPQGYRCSCKYLVLSKASFIIKNFSPPKSSNT